MLHPTPKRFSSSCCGPLALSPPCPLSQCHHPACDTHKLLLRTQGGAPRNLPAQRPAREREFPSPELIATAKEVSLSPGGEGTTLGLSHPVRAVVTPSAGGQTAAASPSRHGGDELVTLSTKSHPCPQQPRGVTRAPPAPQQPPCPQPRRAQPKRRRHRERTPKNHHPGGVPASGRARGRCQGPRAALARF